jgi:predicted phage-related endonuclease
MSRGLSEQQRAAREGKLTASRVSCLMTGDKAKVIALWREMIDDPAHEQEDLSYVWRVQLGAHTEPLNLEWFERKHGAISRVGEVVVHPTIDWAAATIDAWSGAYNCPIEAKHVSGFESLDTIIARYQPQMHWQMIVTGAQCCALSVIMGAREPIVEFIRREQEYADELMHRAESFMACVLSMTPPVVLPPIAAPIKSVKEYDFTGNNAWANEAAEWAETINARKRNEKAEKSLKAMVPDDAVRCFGHWVIISRDRAGRLSIKEQVS